MVRGLLWIPAALFFVLGALWGVVLVAGVFIRAAFVEGVEWVRGET